MKSVRVWTYACLYVHENKGKEVAICYIRRENRGQGK